MGQAAAAREAGRFGYRPALLCLAPLLLPLSSPAQTRAVVDPPAPHPVGVLEQPCGASQPTPASAASFPRSSTPGPVAGTPGVSTAPAMSSAAAPTESKDFYERLLDPGMGRELESPEPAALAAARAAIDDRLRNDWAGLCRYRTENAAAHHSQPPHVVFMGDSITEFWKVAHPEFFGEGWLDRGVAGQTTAQILVRFHQDVIALKPAVVHILAGTNDIAGNGGATTLETIRNNIVSMVDLATANDIRVVLGSVPPAGAFPWRPSVLEAAQHIVDLNEHLRRLARDRGLIYVDYHEALADERDAMKETFSNDGVHPNRDGYTAMEPLARRAIEQALAAAADAGSHGTPAKSPKDKTGSARR